MTKQKSTTLSFGERDEHRSKVMEDADCVVECELSTTGEATSGRQRMPFVVVGCSLEKSSQHVYRQWQRFGWTWQYSRPKDVSFGRTGHTRTSLVSIHKMWVMNVGKCMAPMTTACRTKAAQPKCCCVNRPVGGKHVENLFQAMKLKKGDWRAETGAMG